MSKNLSLKYILEHFPLRIAVTDFCNLKCFFCSNEGMAETQKNTTFVEFPKVKFLIETLVKGGLKNISITGGEPTLYPHVNDLIKLVNRSGIENRFFHTNGVGLSKELIDNGLRDFTKIAVSVHAFDYKIWKKLTDGTLSQYNSMINNLCNLKECFQKIEVKHVPIKGYNSSPEVIKKTLDFCSENQFKFKFLNFEPIEKGQESWIITFSDMQKILEDLGCRKLPIDKKFRGQTDYLPIFWYEYGNTKGVLIEIGCGDLKVCQSCFLSNEIFIDPKIRIKPCHMNERIIDLNKVIDEKNEEGIFDLIVKSRKVLKERPGENKTYWRQLE